MNTQRVMQVREQCDSLPTEVNELKPNDMPEIVVTKAEFTTDARVIEIGFRL